MRSKLLLAPALMACVLIFSASAQAVTLASLLVGGATLNSTNGSVTFSNFVVKGIKRLSNDYSLYEVTATASGIKLTSPQFTVNSGGLRKLDLSYTVTANSGTITGASLAMQGTKSTGKIKVEKDINSKDSASEVGTFLATVLAGSTSLLSDSDTFSPGEKSFDVDEQIRIKKVSALTSVDNGYTVVAEPSMLSLLAAGLGGLAWIGRRRTSA